VSLAQLRQTRIQLEHKLSETSRELFLIKTDPSNGSLFRPFMPHDIPVHAQKKDALYWHQTCRTLQMHNAQLKRELECKTDQCARLTAACRITGSPRGTGSSPGKRRPSIDSST
jgi:hypothetical protein